MKEPLVSIGIPTYNRPNELERALNSVLNQSYTNLEIIISDNCTPGDDVALAVKKYDGDHRIVYFKQPENKGSTFNFNFVLEKSTGEYFKWLGDDDWIDKDYVLKCVESLQENPDFSGAYGFAKMYSDKAEYVTDDAKIDLIQVEPLQRILDYYAKVGNNGCFYGLFRNQDKKYLKVKNRIADDWIAVSRLLYKGQVKLVDGINTCLCNAGLGSNLDQLTKSTKLSAFVRAFPFLSVGLNAFRDILWGSEVYGEMNFFKRFNFASKCFKVIWNRHNIQSELRPGVRKYLRFKLKNQ
jgi:glycosyltransferase involved in cell wall biosynthesis